MRPFALAALLLGLSTLCAAQNSAYWNYHGKTGPLVWGKLDPSYQACSKGHEQSPVDIRRAHLDKALPPIEFHYVAGAVTLENTGRGIVAHVDPGSDIVIDGTRYDLVRYEFHHPSEHAVRGKLSDIEVDLVHKSSDGKEAIVAVLLNEDIGNPNATIATLWQHLPAKAGASEKITDMVNTGGLLPADRGYWTYTRSELTPPCAEGVRWFVFETPLTLSRSQLGAFLDLFRMNTRPLQDLHGRQIEANE
ncbi:MAG TPA: carbonic anhydrase family protein [Terracidiphilus sp.]